MLVISRFANQSIIFVDPANDPVTMKFERVGDEVLRLRIAAPAYIGVSRFGVKPHSLSDSTVHNVFVKLYPREVVSLHMRHGVASVKFNELRHEVCGRVAAVAIDAPQTIQIYRHEIYPGQKGSGMAQVSPPAAMVGAGGVVAIGGDVPRQLPGRSTLLTS